MESSFIQSVVPATTWYNGDPVESTDEGYSALYNKQCGGFTLVQHRVKEYDSKPYMPSYHSLYPTVWPNLGGDTSTAKPVGGLGRGDETHSFGPGTVYDD
jgi:hypothetical protein